MTPSQFVADLENDDNVRRFMSSLICCNGQDCGCQGATVADYLKHIAKEATHGDETRA
jgi:hypothetical protein